MSTLPVNKDTLLLSYTQIYRKNSVYKYTLKKIENTYS